MRLSADPRNVDAWARRVVELDDDAEYERALEVLAASPESALRLLGALALSSEPTVRAWAGNTASKLFRAAAIPILSRLARDPVPDVRDSAREDWIGIDPDVERALLPASREVLRRGKDKWGEDRAAMFRVARMRDTEAIPVLREYASRYAPGEWHNRMALVLADYIEDPTSITRRIRSHDHEFMFWLADAAMLLGVSGGREALEVVRDQPMDEACAQIARDRVGHSK